MSSCAGSMAEEAYLRTDCYGTDALRSWSGSLSDEKRRRPHPFWVRPLPLVKAALFSDSEWRLRVFLAGIPVDVRPGGPTNRDQAKSVVLVFLFSELARWLAVRSDDHVEKYQCKNKIVDHWGVSFLGLAFGRPFE